MPAIITDQFRILNADTFTKSLTGIGTTTNYYYSFLAHPNPTFNGVENYGDASNWPTEPMDSFQQENLYHDSMLFLKSITSQDVAKVVPRYDWTSGVVYDMYRNDYDIDNPAAQTSSKTLYDSRFYVMNSEYRVYLCINNGSNPSFTGGQKSIVEPTGTSIQPQTSSTDGYTWKYLFSINPSEIIKFTTDDYIPVPSVWGDADTEDVKNAAQDGHIETIVILDRGNGYAKGGLSNFTVNNVEIEGDGTGGEATIIIKGGEVDSVVVSNGGSGYTRAFIRLISGKDGITSVGTGQEASFEVPIPPRGGHGFDIYRELGSYRVMIYSKYDADPDYVIGNDFSRVGIIKNPLGFSGSLINSSTATSLGAIKLSGANLNYPINARIEQEVGAGQTAMGYVASYNSETNVLRYYQPVGISTFATAGFTLNKFSGTNAIKSFNLTNTELESASPDTSFSGNTVTIGSKSIALGQAFIAGYANPDIKKYSGDIIYIDNRAPITRSSSQKEEVKIVVEF